jgi:hypothetical protein
LPQKNALPDTPAVVHSNKAGYAFQEAPVISETNRFWEIGLPCPDKSSIGIADYKQTLSA